MVLHEPAGANSLKTILAELARPLETAVDESRLPAEAAEMMSTLKLVAQTRQHGDPAAIGSFVLSMA